MANIAITIEGLEELERRLGRMASIDVLRLPMTQSVETVRSEAQKYPPKRKRRMKFKSRRQRFFVIIAIREGRIQVPYKRRHSGGLAGGWNTKVHTVGQTLVGRIENRVSYGPFVMGPTAQADYHRGNWPTTIDVLHKTKTDIEGFFEVAIEKALI